MAQPTLCAVFTQNPYCHLSPLISGGPRAKDRVLLRPPSCLLRAFQISFSSLASCLTQVVAPAHRIVSSSASAPIVERYRGCVTSPWQRLVLFGRSTYSEEGWRGICEDGLGSSMMPWWEPFEPAPVRVALSGALVPQSAGRCFSLCVCERCWISV